MCQCIILDDDLSQSWDFDIVEFEGWQLCYFTGGAEVALFPASVFQRYLKYPQ